MSENPPETEGVDAIDDPAVIDAIFEDLAKLGRVEYDRCRKEQAERLGIRIATLDEEVSLRRPKRDDGDSVANDLGLFEPEPSDESIDGNVLLDRIVDALRRHVVMPTHASEAVALWIIHCPSPLEAG